MAEARLFVLSDLHAHDERFATPLGHAAPETSPGKPSWLEYSGRAPSERDPILSLLKLIQDANISAQFLLIPGDICHKANGDALRSAWDDIDRIRDALGADATIATAGNHDLDSRYRAHPYDPRNALQNLSPTFPLTNDDANAAYWGFGISQIAYGETRFVIVNSCAFHGGAPAELEHGRISPIALERLSAMLAAGPDMPLNVLLCHHHPYPIAGIGYGRDDRMMDGETLLDILDSSEFSWLVIHGHRHAARILYAGGSAYSPVVLAAGSASIRLSPPLSVMTRNQAHLLTVVATPGSIDINGVVDTWNYNPLLGWEPASRDGGLPQRCGFGHRGSLSALADQIGNTVRSNGGPMLWERLITLHPEAQYLTPRDFDRLKACLVSAGVSLVESDSLIEVAEL
jgi:hypothetical protein